MELIEVNNSLHGKINNKNILEVTFDVFLMTRSKQLGEMNNKLIISPDNFSIYRCVEKEEIDS